MTSIRKNDNISRKSIRAIDPKYIIVGHCTGDRFYDLARAELRDEVIEIQLLCDTFSRGEADSPSVKPSPFFYRNICLVPMLCTNVYL